MPTWSQITQPYGVYISETFNISNHLDKYIATIIITEINIHNQILEYFYSVSHNEVEWSEWKEFSAGSTGMFNDYDLENLYFRYKVIIKSEDDTQKPYLQSIS